MLASSSFQTGRTSRRGLADLVAACSDGKLVVSRPGEEYDARKRRPIRGPRVNRTQVWRMRTGGDVMIKPPVFLISISSLCILCGCASGGGNPPPPVTATHFSVITATQPAAGTPFSFIVTALGASGQMATSYAGTVHFASSDPQAALPAASMLTNVTGTFTATLKTAGPQTITATDANSLSGSSTSINVSPGAASHFSVTAPTAASAGLQFFFTVTAFDAYNNIATNYSGTVHFSSSDGQAVLPLP
jgi:hypothetical protein